ncbi:WbuC family cupin fold metalloprotein [Nitrospirillum iridis]|uniref:Glucose-6-phosphate isomerase n=1 Tax=Nitrospirillum iridis TaxID=765888 RepID=A0A7X0EEP5_9PROT|nr:WbuC family cupin fold metalloprotein [Nitrospirillum iridis]MBB6252271.1 glucose-6-phosphate isomerase [Nitrospirillum iridis]
MTEINPYSSKAYFDDWTDFLDIDRTRLDALLDESRRDERGRVRICLHRSEADPVQEMIIALADHGYLRPHRQRGLQKSYVVLAGRLRVVFFDESGGVLRRLDLDAQRRPLARFDSGIWHTMTSLSEGTLYLETILGPFDRNRTDWAPWAPGRAPRPEIEAYMRDVLRV